MANMAKKILIAEDDTFLANAYRMKLSKSGFDIKIVIDGAEAIKEVKEFSPDVIVLDLVMPKKDGFAVLEELKQDSQFSHIPILVVSNLGQESDVEKAQQLGATDYVIKSNESLKSIVARIEKIVERTQQK